jgi:hypothetical protein
MQTVLSQLQVGVAEKNNKMVPSPFRTQITTAPWKNFFV